MENAQDEYIEALILYRIWYSHKGCKTETKIPTRLKALTYKMDKIDMLKDNIQIRVIAFGWEEFKTLWSKDGGQKIIPELQKTLERDYQKEKGKRDTPSAH